MATASAEGDKLTLGYLFVNGLRSKVGDIRVLIETHNIDVLALGRTNLDGSIDDAEIEIDGFQVSRRDRNPTDLGPGGAGGGVVIYVREGITPDRKKVYEHTDVDSLWVTLTRGGWRQLLVGCCYRPTRTGKEYLDEINEQITEVTQEMADKYIFLMGTFNIDWNKNTPEKRRLNKAAKISELRQIVDEPYRVDTEKVIDHIYTNIQENIPVQPIDETPSDHKIFLVTVNRNYTTGTTGGVTGGATGTTGGVTGGATGTTGGVTGGATGEDELSSKMEKLGIKKP